MQPIPTPQVLDPDRILVNDRGDLTVDHESRAKQLDDALHESCTYAQQLWHDLDAMRGYLFNSLPFDPRAPGPHPSTSASPTGPDDDAGWENWVTAYAAVTSALCGPHGDSGYGLGEARREATLRRTAPVMRVYADHPGLGTPEHQEQARLAHLSESTPDPGPVKPGRSQFGRTAATVVLVLLALRGLRPRRRTFA